MYCLQLISSEDVLNEHNDIGISINRKQAIKMPSKDEKVSFKNIHKQFQAPCVIYVDFEALTEKNL